MVIFLDSSLVVGLKHNKPNRHNILSALSICAQQVREGSHILMGDRGTFEEIKLYFNELDLKTASILSRSSAKLTFRKRLRNYVKRMIRIVSDEADSTPRRRLINGCYEIILPAKAIDACSSLLSPAMLMVENLDDGKGYMKLAKSIVEHEAIDGTGWLCNIPLRSEIMPGGGNTLSSLYKHQKVLGARLGIAIADGDYRYMGSPIGQTARSLCAASRASPQTPLLETYILNVRSIENCLPRAEVARILCDLDTAQLNKYERLKRFAATDTWNVLPIKQGIRCYEVRGNSSESVFWTQILGGRECSDSESCRRKEECNRFLLEPISGKVLTIAANQDNLFDITDACSAGMLDEWCNLVDLFYSLFCGSERTANN